MGCALFCWELGAGLAHMMQIAPLAEGLARRHRVFVALRDLRRGRDKFGARVLLLPTPSFIPEDVDRRPAASFSDILLGVGWDSDDGLLGLTSAWRNLYTLVRADLVVFDHSPTALLASQGMPVRRVLLGNGFLTPPDTCPFPDLRPWAGADRLPALQDEARVLARVNRLLELWKQPPLKRLGQLFSRVDHTLLTTFPEIDPYRSRRPAETEYLGPVIGSGGAPPEWPEGGGKRVFAYLRPSAAMPEVLNRLRDCGLPTIALVDQLYERTRCRLESPSLRFLTRAVDLRRAGRECDLAVLNGNFGTTCSMLLSGKPSLQLPLTMEQTWNARAVQELGAGRATSGRRAGAAAGLLDALLGSTDYAAAAVRFAERYRGFDPKTQCERMLNRLAAHLN